jgi:hypothetical protein
MKIKLLMAGLLGLVSATTFAQNSELKNAKNEFEKYQSFRGQKALAIVKIANESLTNAKTAIDKASVNEKTAALPLTFALKAAVYASLANQDTIPATSAPLFVIADEAAKKAKELDTKSENAKIIEDANLNLAQYKLTAGVKDYQANKFEDAYKDFDYYRQVLPNDTIAIYYTALSASNAGRNNPKFYSTAIDNYKKLVTTAYGGKAKVYMDMSSLYLLTKDTVGALNITSEAVTKYPKNSDLRKREIEIALQSGKQSDVLTKIQNAIANDPKNKELYYYAGLTYAQVAESAEAKIAKEKDGPAKAALRQTAADNNAKAADMYKKAIEVDPDYFEANLNLGSILMKPGIDLYNVANNMPSNTKQKDYDDARLKADKQFNIALPYLLKAQSINPKSDLALTNLRNYYRGVYDPTHTAENKAKADELKKQLDALGVKN